MAAKQSEVVALLGNLVRLLNKEVQQALDPSSDAYIPLAASDKAVALALIKHCGVTTAPDDPALDALKQNFSTEIAEKRAAREATAASIVGAADGLDGLMH